MRAYPRRGAMTDEPAWVKWHFAKWRGDAGLRLCSLAARGLWADLLAIMAECRPYGHLVVQGQKPTDSEIAAMVGNTTSREVAKCLGQLERFGVFSLADGDVIYNRRMVRDHAARERGKADGALGGNPALRGDKAKTEKGLTGGDNPPPYPREEKNREEKKEPSPTAQGARGRGRRLPDGWMPDLELSAYAQNLGLDARQVAEIFSDYWHAQPSPRGLKADWSATWRGWCRREAERGGGSSSPGRVHAPRQPALDDFIDAERAHILQETEHDE